MTTTSAPPPSTTLSPLAPTRFPCLHHVAAGLQRYRARWLPPLRLDAVHLRGAARDQVLAVRTRLPAVSIPGEPVTVLRGIWQFSNSKSPVVARHVLDDLGGRCAVHPLHSGGRDTLMSETEVLGFHSPVGRVQSAGLPSGYCPVCCQPDDPSTMGACISGYHPQL